MLNEKLLGVNSRNMANRRGYTKVFSNILYTTKSTDAYIQNMHLDTWSLYYLSDDNIADVLYEIQSSELFLQYYQSISKMNLNSLSRNTLMDAQFILSVIPDELKFYYNGCHFILVPSRYHGGVPVVDDPNTQTIIEFYERHASYSTNCEFWTKQITKVIENPDNVIKNKIHSLHDIIMNNIIKVCS